MQWSINKGLGYQKFKKNFFSKLIKNNSESKLIKDFEKLEEENSSLLSNCIDPQSNHTGLSTLLALGLIQSGKTSSIELLSNLARDNGYKLIIVMSGTVGTLTKQTQERLYQSMNGIGWKRFYIPGYRDGATLSIENTANEIIKSFATWDNEIFTQSEKRSVVIVTMKNIPRLTKLLKILKSIYKRDEHLLKNIPALIIDDECDHASLNNRTNREEEEFDLSDIENSLAPEYGKYNQETIDDFLEEYGIEIQDLIRLNENINNIYDLNFGEIYRISDFESATHRRIKLIRRLLPFSSYIGYTATPFANLLIDTVTNLSPNFAQILSPGSDYMGAKDFFSENDIEHHHVNTILVPEISALYNANDYPPSLKIALRIFILGIANGIFYKDHEKNNARSMFIHTAAEVSSLSGGYLSHENIISLITEDIENLIDLFENSRINNDKNLIKNELILFKEAYDELIKTDHLNEKKLITFEDAKNLYIEKALNFIDIIEFNARNKSSIPIMNWYDEGYGRILVGGHGLDRGYTIEGLTVSYLLRTPSIQRDTSLQRARFFGYQKKNIGLFRIFLPSVSKENFISTSAIENHMRNSISDFLAKDKNLKNWPRIFLSERNDIYELTNPKRVAFTMLRNQSQYQNIKDSAQHDITEIELLENQNLRNLLLQESQPINVINSPRTYINKFKHRIILSKNLDFVYNLLKKGVSFSTSGKFNFDTSLFLINKFLEKYPHKKELNCPIIIMDDIRKTDGQKMKRGVALNNNISIQSNRGGAPYDQDRLVHYEYLTNLDHKNEYAKQIPTLQIYNFKVIYNEKSANEFTKHNVPFFFLYIPDSVFEDYQFQIAIPNS